MKSLEANTNPTDYEWPKNCRLLLVEDNSINQTVVQGMLAEYQLKCETANNGQEAIELLQLSAKEYPYTLALMDCQMPILDGYETTRRIRKGSAGQRYRHIPIVAMTANAMSGDREKCLDAGMNDYLPKPITIAHLYDKLCIWLKSAAPKKETNHPQLESSNEPVLWDQTEALKRVRNKSDRLDTLIDMFRESAPQLINDIRVALTDENRVAAIHHSHTLKGVAGNLSAHSLMDAAEALELRLRTNETDDLMPLVENIIQQHNMTLERFDRFQGRESSPRQSAGK